MFLYLNIYYLFIYSTNDAFKLELLEGCNHVCLTLSLSKNLL